MDYLVEYVILGCMIILAIEPLERIIKRGKNSFDRIKSHLEWRKRDEGN